MLSDDLNACADLLRRGDPDRFLAAMAAPVAARRVLFPIYAFNLEVARAPWVTQEPMIAEMRLQWWRDALGEIREGAVVRRHEVVTPLALVLDPASAARLDDLIEARRWDIYREPFADPAAFERYISDTSTSLLAVSAKALGPADEAVLADAGYALGLANWLRAIPALEAAGRIPLVDGRSEALRELASDGLARLSRARKARHKVSRAARPALLPLWQVGPVLARAEHAPNAVAEGRLDISPARSRLTLMMRATTGRW